MINDIKMSFKVLMYGLNFKQSILVMVIFTTLGFVMDVAAPWTTTLSSLYSALNSVFVAQMIHSVVQSTMVQSSPYKKALQTKIPVTGMGIFLLIINTLSVFLKLILSSSNPEYVDIYANALFFSGIMFFVIMIYFALALKWFWPATIIFFISFYSIFYGSIMQKIVIGFNAVGVVADNYTIQMGFAIVFSYASIILGSLITYGINVLFYKRDYSKQNFEAALKRGK